MAGKLDIRTIYNSTFTERDQFLALAERVAFLTLPHIDPRPGRLEKGEKFTSILRRIPFNSFGSSAVKGLTASLNQTLNPAGIKFFKLDTDPAVTLDDSQQVEMDKFLRKEEKRMVEWLARHNFSAFSDQLIERVLIEGTEGVRMDPDEGFTLYKTRNLAISRRGENVFWIVFEGFVDSQNEQGVTETKILYTYVNKRTGEIWTQMEDDDEGPTQVAGVAIDEETGELIELEGDNPKFWFLVTTEVPQFNNFAHAFYMSHLSLLEEIEDSAKSLKNAKRVAGHFFYTMDPTGVGEITPQRFARIKNNEVVPMAHDKVRPWTSGQAINDWEWVDRKLQQDGQRLLNISAVGIFARRAGVKTATEVRAIRAELETLIGSTANILAQSFHFKVVDALIDVLGIRKRLRDHPAMDGVPNEMIDRLVRGLVVTGSPQVSRERELEKLQQATEHALALFGEKALQEFNVRGWLDTVFDNLDLNTDAVFISEEASEALKQPKEPQQVVDEVADNAVTGLTGPLPPNGQLNRGESQFAEIRAGGVL